MLGKLRDGDYPSYVEDTLYFSKRKVKNSKTLLTHRGVEVCDRKMLIV
jgi:hypothetical protein